MKLTITMTFTMCMLATAARADKPSLDEVKQAANAFRESVADTADAEKAAKPAEALALTIDAFWYDGFDYYGSDQTAKACKKKFGAKGKTTAENRGEFLDCAARGMWSAALDGDAEWKALDVKKLPAVFKKHKSKLAKLSKDHALVMSHFVPAGPAEHWNLYAATRAADGKVKLAALLTVNKVYEE